VIPLCIRMLPSNEIVLNVDRFVGCNSWLRGIGRGQMVGKNGPEWEGGGGAINNSSLRVVEFQR
jgi:hypothetical protein